MAPHASEPATLPRPLLDAAFRTFAQRGYRATRLDDVAAAAHLTKGAIYHHFESKEDLLRRAVADRHRELFAEIGEALAAEDAPATVRIRLVLRKLWQHWTEPGWGHAFRLLVGDVSVELPDVFQLWLQEGPGYAWGVLRDQIALGMRTGEFRPDADAEVAARIILSGLMLQCALQVHLGAGETLPCDPDRIFDSAVDLLLRGLAPCAPAA